MITLVCITDGRFPPTIEHCLNSVEHHVSGIDEAIIIDDSADSSYGSWLDERFTDHKIIHHPERRGLGGAVHSAWTIALTTPADHILHWEDDFTASHPVNLYEMARLLDMEPNLSQLVLKRQPWSAEEIAAGGQIEVSPDAYTDRQSDAGSWVEHSLLFSFNPCLIRRDAIDVALTHANDTLERGVTDALLQHGYQFAYYGMRYDSPRVEHIGHTRSQNYRW